MHAQAKKDQEMNAKKKSTQGGPKSYKGRPGSAMVDSGQLTLEEDSGNMPTLEENASVPQQVYLHLNKSFNCTLLKISRKFSS